MLNEIVFFHRESQTLILTDIAYHFDESFSLKTQLAARLIRGYNRLTPSLLEKIATPEKEKVKYSIQKVFCWDFRRVIMAHGSIIENWFGVGITPIRSPTQLVCQGKSGLTIEPNPRSLARNGNMRN